MPVSEFHRAQTVRLISNIASQLSQSGAAAQVVAQAEGIDGEVPIPNVELLIEESEVQGLHFILHREEKDGATRFVGIISRFKDLDPDQLQACLKQAMDQEKNPGAQEGTPG